MNNINSGMNQMSNQMSINKLLQMPDFSNVREGGTSITALKQLPTTISTTRDKPYLSPNSFRQPHFKPNNDNNINEDFNTENESLDYKSKKLKKLDHLVSDINRSLDDYSPSRSIISEESEEEEITNKRSINSYIPNFVKEPLLLIIIYVIMSQEFVHKMLSNYIPYVNVNDEGRVPLLGIIIYGSIMAVIFMFFRKILI